MLLATHPELPPRDANRLLSLSGRGNLLTGWLEGTPADEASRLPDMVVMMTVRWTLGLPLPAGLAGGRCICGRTAAD